MTRRVKCNECIFLVGITQRRRGCSLRSIVEVKTPNQSDETVWYISNNCKLDHAVLGDRSFTPKEV